MVKEAAMHANRDRQIGRIVIIGALSAIATLLANAGFAQPRVAPQGMEQVRLSFAPIVRNASPAVVNIYSQRVVRTQARSPFMSDPFFRRFFGGDLDNFFGMPQESVQRSLGSGVIVSADGVIVTNNHVIDGFDEITVVLSDRREFEAEVLLADEQTDLAVLRIDPGDETLPHLEYANSDAAEVGDVVLAIGNPFGIGQTVTSGIISATARTRVGVTDYGFFLQTDAAINPGNSGGALVDIDGRLLGVNSAIYSRSGGSNGVGFAIPANMVSRVVRSAVIGGELRRPWIGADAQGVSADLALSLALDRPVGALVTEVFEGGPADRAGLREGDVILAINDFEVLDEQALRFRIATEEEGESVRIRFVRDGVERSAAMRLALPPETPPRELTLLDGRQPFSGAEVGNLSPAFNEEQGRPLLEKGVVITRIDSRSTAARLGWRVGDKIVAVNGRSIGSVSDLRDATSREREVWDIIIERGGRRFRRQFRG
ncbi:MAG: Do family serine endopeptidase [Parvularculaceae bacterium]